MAQFVSYNCITSPAANYTKGTDSAWPSVHRQYFQGQFKRTEHKFCISMFNKVTGMEETWEHDTKPQTSSLQSQLCLGDKGSGKYHCLLSLQLRTSSAWTTAGLSKISVTKPAIKYSSQTCAKLCNALDSPAQAFRVNGRSWGSEQVIIQLKD